MASYTSDTGNASLEGHYRIHIDEGEIAFLESGRDGEGLTEWQVRHYWPELAESVKE